MKYLCSLIFLAACQATVAAGDTCEFGGLSIPVGESRPGLVGDCSQYTCHSSGSISGKGCGSIASNVPNYIEVQDKSRIYPACCPYLVRSCALQFGIKYLCKM